MYGITPDVSVDSFWFPDSQGQLNAFCGVEIYDKTSQTPIVVIMEKSDNPDGSITNKIETIATMIAHKYDLEGHRCKWLEYYPEGTKPTSRPWFSGWAQVRFQWVQQKARDAQWTLIQEKQARRVIRREGTGGCQE